MAEKGSISQAENRVKEMNRMTRQLLEQSNRAFRQGSLQNMQRNSPSYPSDAPRGGSGTRFEQMNRSRPPQSGAGQRPGPAPSPPPALSAPLPAWNKPCENSPAPKRESGFGELFGADGERLLIILIIVLLMKEKADMKLIIALGYLLI